MEKKEYDVKDVDDYIADVMKLHSLERVELWLALSKATNWNWITDNSRTRFVSRFIQYGFATRANILFRFIPILEDVAREVAKAKAAEAQEAGAM